MGCRMDQTDYSATFAGFETLRLYDWRFLRLATPPRAPAVLETKQSEMPARLTAALQALQERLDSPAGISTDERTAIENARKALMTLKDERVEGRTS